MSAYDLEHANVFFNKDELEGVQKLPKGLKKVVRETFETGEIVEPPGPTVEPPKANAKKVHGKKTKVRAESDVEYDEAEDGLQEPKGDLLEKISPLPAAKNKTRKSKAKKRHTASRDGDSGSEPEYMAKKSKSRSVPFQGAAAPTEAAPEE